ncbi:dirigent protein 19-like [Coffea eugenioides]|uniref:Dirigent protein n=1 Tax=Coffea arabica TaxID=13443 RepID=A0A6P6S3S8_COFAR|nr:dirigent protein 19-like [Coffea arabica]XP_027171968.1 dirigent protein 19-like [Coffea eugenioides]
MAKSLAIASLQILGVLLLASLAQSKHSILHLTLYDHEFKGPTAEHNQTIYPVAGLPNVKWGFLQFGTLFIGTNILKETISFHSPTVGHLHGVVGVASLDGFAIEALASVHFLEHGKYNGSTVEIKGVINQDQQVSEVAIVGGTKQFRYATGYMTFTGTPVVNATGHNVYKLDLHIRLDKKGDSPGIALQ